MNPAYSKYLLAADLILAYISFLSPLLFLGLYLSGSDILQNGNSQEMQNSVSVKSWQWALFSVNL